jgi:hypothetical protein
MSKYEGNIPILQRIKQLERQHDVQRPSFYGAHWRESLDICNTLVDDVEALGIANSYLEYDKDKLAEQKKDMLDMIKIWESIPGPPLEPTWKSIRREMRELIARIEGQQ